MRHDRIQRVDGKIRSDRDECDIEQPRDLAGIDDSDAEIEASVGHVDLQPGLAYRLDVFPIHVHKRYIVPGARESSSDDASNRSGSDDYEPHGSLSPSARKRGLFPPEAESLRITSSTEESSAPREKAFETEQARSSAIDRSL
jgi:hypothetical protein